MVIKIFEPFSKGFNRMVDGLFRKFDIRKWFVVGFTAFLAGLLDYNGGAAGHFDGDDFAWNRRDWEDLWHYPSDAWLWMIENAFWFILGIFILIVVIAIIVTLLWLSSRGKFMFLDNVVHNKSEVANPWRNYGKLGNSLFLFRLVFGLVCAALVITWIVLGVSVVVGLGVSESAGPLLWLMIAFGILSFMLLILVLLFIDMLIEDFMIPIMYKFNLTALPAMRRLIELVSKHVGKFILYALVRLLLVMAVFAGIMFFGFFTCCVGFLILLIPYISDVVLLPVSYTFRSFSVEFLEQFGDEYKIFPAAEKQQ